METDLWIEGVYFPRFSARECTQELWPVMDDRLFQRTINGTLLFLGHEKDLKYKTIMTCNDQSMPVMGHISKGSMVKVGCLQFISQPLLKETTKLCRSCIEGSISVFSMNHTATEFTSRLEENDIYIESKEGCYVTFRPILCMRVIDFRFIQHEWGEKNGWSITLEEV